MNEPRSEGGTGESTGGIGGMTVPLGVHVNTIFEYRDRVNNERDRRLSEVAVEREKALKIKETADLAALQLAREIQTYKDEKANELREQINSERGLYATKDDVVSAVEKVEATLTPLVAAVTALQGEHTGESVTTERVIAAIAVAAAIVALVIGR